MKEKSAVNMAAPYGWFYQAGIHGTFWNTMKDLTKLASERGFGSPKQLESGDKILNNSTHNSGSRNEVARLGQEGSNEANAGGITPNFVPCHWIYHRSFESVVRMVLKDSGEANAKSYILPYWDYTIQRQGGGKSPPFIGQAA